MTKKSVLYTALITFMLSFTLIVGLSNAMDKGPEELVLTTEKGKKPASFPHAKHQEAEGITCGVCHHSKDTEGKQIAFIEGQEIKGCVTCHNTNDMSNTKLNSYKSAAHQLCKDCHKAKKKEGFEAPTKCTGCHIKN